MPSFRAAAAAVALVAAVAACGSDAEDGEDLGGSWTATLQPTPSGSALYPNGTGTVKVSSSDGTSVQLTVAEIGSGTDYMAHVHDGECDEDPPGGGHWLGDPAGEDAAGNIVELSFTTSATGTGETTVSSALMLDDRAESIVVHAPDSVVQAEGLASDRILCGDLEEG